MARIAFVLVAWALSLTLAHAAGASSKAAPSVNLTQKLERATDARIDIDMKTGQSYVRCKLIKITPGGKDGVPKMIKFQETDDSKPITIGFSSVRSLTLDREQVYLAPESGAKSGKTALVERDAKAAAAEREKWVARAVANRVKVWPELSAEEHKKEDKAARARIEKIKAQFPATSTYETGEFLFVSDMPRDAVVFYAASLDEMYDMMCQMYGIKRGTTVFKSKCLIVAFVNRSDFMKYEQEFHKYAPGEHVQGLCHSVSTGDVSISCFFGESSPERFGHVLVHETSHGFIFRYRTLANLPSWANEGMAEWIGQSLVGEGSGVPRSRMTARETMREGASVRGMFDAAPIDMPQYGMAADLTGYLIQKDKRKYAEWINGIKEGTPWKDSLQQAYGVTPEQLLAEYGVAIGVPGLKP